MRVCAHHCLLTRTTARPRAPSARTAQAHARAQSAGRQDPISRPRTGVTTRNPSCSFLSFVLKYNCVTYPQLLTQRRPSTLHTVSLSARLTGRSRTPHRPQYSQDCTLTRGRSRHRHLPPSLCHTDQLPARQPQPPPPVGAQRAQGGCADGSCGGRGRSRAQQVGDWRNPGCCSGRQRPPPSRACHYHQHVHAVN